MTIMTSRASITVPTPTVRAIFGTSEMSLLKNRELAMIVSYAYCQSDHKADDTKVLILVRDVRLLPGSLKAICPSGPMPWVRYRFIWRSYLLGIIQFLLLYGSLLHTSHIPPLNFLRFHLVDGHS
jgi:hypothetical protein